MRRTARILVACMFSLTFLGDVGAGGSVQEGEKIARDACARCHDVERNGPFKQHPPSFASIAVFRSEEQIYGRIVFPPLHSSMPQLGFMLTPENVDHVMAYIVSLETR